MTRIEDWRGRTERIDRNKRLDTRRAYAITVVVLSVLALLIWIMQLPPYGDGHGRLE